MKRDRMNIISGMILTGLLVGCVSRPERPDTAPMEQQVKVTSAPPGPQIVLPVTLNPNDPNQGWVLLNGSPVPVRQDAGSWKIIDLGLVQQGAAAATPVQPAPATPVPAPTTGQPTLTQAKTLLEIDKIQLERALLNRLNELSGTITSVDELNAVLEKMGVVIQQLNPPPPSP